MSSNPKISVIIPVYGVEKYITKCIESIKNQTFTNFEAILINDGTKDNSVAVAEDAIAGDDRFIILHKENGGQGSARNLGLDKARGDYIAFIDSDDYVEPRFLQAMYEKIIEDDADICTCNARLLSPSDVLQKKHTNDPMKYLKEGDVLNSKFYISNWFWDNKENRLKIEGDYIDLFHISSALIHDSGSFIAEYLATRKPVMFLISNENIGEEFNSVGRESLKCHYQARTKKDIDNFIRSVVIDETDNMQNKRNDFFNKYLLSPNKNLASQNIFDYILEQIGSNE